MDLHAFLEKYDQYVFKVREPISVHHEITALQYALEKKGRRPIILVEKPKLTDGSISEIPLVCNLTASRQLTAEAIGVDDFRNFAQIYDQRKQQPVKPRIVSPRQTACQEIVLEGADADLRQLPALIQHELAPGPYLTAAHVCTYDPDSHVDNTAIQRCWIRGKTLTSLFTYPTTHNMRNIKKFWAQKQPCPVALWIGHHPAVVIGTQAKMRYPESHWEAAGSFIGEPLRLAPSITHGDKLMVPAEAEIVIEGFVPLDKWEADGPFGEYTGYVGPQTLAQILEVTCVTRRRNAVYHDYGSGLADMLVPDDLLMEAKLYGMIKAVCPAVVNVHVPETGRRFHAYIQLREPNPGETRDALMAALAYRRIKTAIALSTDVDIYDDREVMWALATRVQWHRDIIQVGGLSGSMLDPSLPAGAKTTSKMGIDATLASPQTGATPKPFLPRTRVNDRALEAAEALVTGIDAHKWPQL